METSKNGGKSKGGNGGKSETQIARSASLLDGPMTIANTGSAVKRADPATLARWATAGYSIAPIVSLKDEGDYVEGTLLDGCLPVGTVECSVPQTGEVSELPLYRIRTAAGIVRIMGGASLTRRMAERARELAAAGVTEWDGAVIRLGQEDTRKGNRVTVYEVPVAPGLEELALARTDLADTAAANARTAAAVSR